jgi:hypothetical protein
VSSAGLGVREDMEQMAIPAKVGLLELARQLGNVSRACKMMGYSRDSFYRFKDRRCATRHLQKDGPFTPWLAGLVRRI